MIERKVFPSSGSFLANAARVVSLVVFSAACHHKPPPPPPEPEPEPEVTEPKPIKEKKKPCEAMSEECVASGDTQAKIPGSNFVFIPPNTWAFAQESGQTIAKSKDVPAAMAVTGYDSGTPAEENKMRNALLPKLAQSIGVALPEKRKKPFLPTWEKPDDTQKVGESEFALWQAEDAKLGDKTGPVLVFGTKDSSGKKVLGIAFSPKGDDKTIDLIMKSLQTFGPGSY
jgi:hypothetical protein